MTTKSRYSAITTAFVGIAITIALFLALRLCRHQADHVFMASSINIAISGTSPSPEDEARGNAIAEKQITALRSEVKKKVHREMLALTVVALILLFLLKRPGIPNWTKYVLLGSAGICIIACRALWPG